MKTTKQILELNAEDFLLHIEKNDVAYSTLEEYTINTSRKGVEDLKKLLEEVYLNLGINFFGDYQHQQNLVWLKQIVSEKIKAHKPLRTRKGEDINSPELTQDQLVLLFYLLRQNKLIHAGKSNITLSECIAELGDYESSENIRQSFSPDKYGDIEKNTKNRGNLKRKLEEIIVKLDSV